MFFVYFFVVFVLVCFVLFCFFSSTQYKKKGGREGVSEKCKEEKAK